MSATLILFVISSSTKNFAGERLICPGRLKILPAACSLSGSENSGQLSFLIGLGHLILKTRGESSRLQVFPQPQARVPEEKLMAVRLYDFPQGELVFVGCINFICHALGRALCCHVGQRADDDLQLCGGIFGVFDEAAIEL